MSRWIFRGGWRCRAFAARNESRIRTLECNRVVKHDEHKEVSARRGVHIMRGPGPGLRLHGDRTLHTSNWEELWSFTQNDLRVVLNLCKDKAKSTCNTLNAKLVG